MFVRKNENVRSPQIKPEVMQDAGMTDHREDLPTRLSNAVLQLVTITHQRLIMLLFYSLLLKTALIKVSVYLNLGRLRFG